jgi:hypothetical integral membrane protein (TIGR02206 family)
MDGFEAFGAMHGVMLALCAAGIWPAALLGRRFGDDPHSPAARRLCQGLAIAIPCFTVPLQLLDLLPGQFSFRTSLPLQLCDVAWLVATLALWTRHRYAVSLTYFWGLVLTTQALVTPALTAGFPSPRFIAFWGSHALIVWAAVFLVFGLGLAPRWRDYATTVATTAGWAVAVYFFNVAAGTNYGYLNDKPATASLLDHLGPWPAYVVAEVLVVATVWALMTWPWERRRLRTGRAASPTPPASAPSGSSR